MSTLPRSFARCSVCANYSHVISLHSLVWFKTTRSKKGYSGSHCRVMGGMVPVSIKRSDVGYSLMGTDVAGTVSEVQPVTSQEQQRLNTPTVTMTLNTSLRTDEQDISGVATLLKAPFGHVIVQTPTRQLKLRYETSWRCVVSLTLLRNLCQYSRENTTTLNHRAGRHAP